MSDRSFFAHPLALLETEEIGAGTRVWAFSHIMKGARLGNNCNVGEHCYIESGVTIGDDVVIKNGVALWEGVKISDKVFIGPYVVFTNDLLPRAKVFGKSTPTFVREGASIGANATLICGITVGSYAMIGAGAVVTRDVADFALVLGNPARLRGHVCSCGSGLDFHKNSRAACHCGASYELCDGAVVRRGPARPVRRVSKRRASV